MNMGKGKANSGNKRLTLSAGTQKQKVDNNTAGKKLKP